MHGSYSSTGRSVETFSHHGSIHGPLFKTLPVSIRKNGIKVIRCELWSALCLRFYEVIIYFYKKKNSKMEIRSRKLAQREKTEHEKMELIYPETA